MIVTGIEIRAATPVDLTVAGLMVAEISVAAGMAVDLMAAAVSMVVGASTADSEFKSAQITPNVKVILV